MGKEINKASRTIKDKKEPKKKSRKISEKPLTELVVSTPGTSIGVQNEMITIKNKGKSERALPHSSNLKNISFTSENTSISVNAINWCIENNIGLDFFDTHGKHIGSLLSTKSCQIQAWISQSSLMIERRCLMAKKIIWAKLKNQYSLLKYYNKYHNKNDVINKEFSRASIVLKRVIAQTLSLSEVTDQYKTCLMSYEAAGAKAYWAYIKVLLTEAGIEFNKRQRHGATDLVNCMLNYGYAILYSRIWRALLRHQINPYDGVIHKNMPNKPVFVYDIVELFRTQAVDRPIFSLLRKGAKCTISDGVLDDFTRSTVARIFAQRQSKIENYRGQKKTLEEIIDSQIEEIYRYIHENHPYMPYLSKW